MAYKNKKHNKRHIAYLRYDPFGWRSRQKQRKREAKVSGEMTMDEVLSLLEGEKLNINR